VTGSAESEDQVTEPICNFPPDKQNDQRANKLETVRYYKLTGDLCGPLYCLYIFFHFYYLTLNIESSLQL
ncbi:hypothetical protein N9W97_04065, partial [Pseudomonadales bacterium]|nr:hypothetical protein [Pseudomonadales bacterium]